MSSLPRIDEVEELLQEKYDQGLTTKDLSKDLLNELKQLSLLDKLISARITNIVMDRLREEYKANTEDQEDNDVTANITRQICHEWFDSQVDRYYLEQRDKFERVSFQMFMTCSKGIAMEAYQRLVEGEESWKTINERWGRESEKENEGRYLQIRPHKMNQYLYKELLRLKKGEISQPIRTGGKTIAIVKLLGWDKSELNQELRDRLQEQLYRDWISKQTEEVIQRIS